MDVDALMARLRGAAYPLSDPPSVLAWNLPELDGLVIPDPPSPAAVLVGVVPRSSGATVLLTRRTEQLRHHAGQVSFPGGRIESEDVSPVAAALREAHEEVGLDAGQVQVLGYLDPLATITGFCVQPVLALVQPEFVAQPDPVEVAEVFEVPLTLLLDPARLERIELQFGGRVRHVFQYRYAQQRIWGATASILFNLRQRLESTNQGSV